MTENGLMESSQTEKLFYNNSHQKSFEATVLSCQKKENYYEIVLDQTAFFPEGGGQYADTGYLGDAKVLDVQEQEGQILHRTDQELPVGEKVTGQLDWELRFMKMQQHTGEHIVSGIVHERYVCAFSCMERRFGFIGTGGVDQTKSTGVDSSGSVCGRSCRVWIVS